MTCEFGAVGDGLLLSGSVSLAGHMRLVLDLGLKVQVLESLTLGNQASGLSALLFLIILIKSMPIGHRAYV